MDTPIRSWTKSITWRILGIVLLGLITYYITRDWKAMAVITVVFHGIRVVLYYVHERVWEHVDWGRVKHPLATLPVDRELTPEDMEIVRDQLKSLGYID
jgi:uncharacterized membrane protein